MLPLLKTCVHKGRTNLGSISNGSVIDDGIHPSTRLRVGLDRAFHVGLRQGGNLEHIGVDLFNGSLGNG